MELVIAVVILAVIVAFFITRKNKKPGTAPTPKVLTDEEVQALTDEAENRDRIK